MRTFAILNMKGGVGKTTTAINLAYLLAAEHRRRVLLIDADPQANATRALLPDGEWAGLAGVLNGRATVYDEVIVPSGIPNLDIMPASDELWEIDLNEHDGEGLIHGTVNALRDLRDAAMEDAAYDVIVIDCPPNFSTPCIAAIAAANSIVIPVLPDAFSAAGMDSLVYQIEGVRRIHPDVHIAGCLVSQWHNADVVVDATAYLALPEKSMDEFIEVSHMVDGEEKTVSEMSVRELKAAIKERDEALKAAEQAKADQKAADKAREQLAQDIFIANERIKGLNAEVEQRDAKVKEAQDAAVRLEKELAELRSRPVEVAVEVDAAAVEAARREAEAAMQEKLGEAKKAQAKADADKKAAEDAKAQAEQELEQARAEARSIREQVERSEKKAAIFANEDLVLFRTLFDQVQEQVNKLGGVLMKIRNKDPETAGPLQKALLALADKVKGVAEG